eukprot:5664093-Pleurochrysis_carterae.AAC.1
MYTHVVQGHAKLTYMYMHDKTTNVLHFPRDRTHPSVACKCRTRRRSSRCCGHGCTVARARSGRPPRRRLPQLESSRRACPSAPVGEQSTPTIA